MDWCAWPPIVPDVNGNGDGFITKKIIVDLRTGEETPYEIDETPRPESVRSPKGAFVTLGKREQGLNAKDLPAKYQRAIVNYFLDSRSFCNWRSVEVGVLTAHRCADAWRGTPWTAVINANEDYTGKLDRLSETGTVPTELLLQQINWYEELGASRIFFWRYDTPRGLAGIDDVMTEIRRLKKSGDWKRKVHARSPFLKMPL